jgi:hypothetical protein
MGGKRKRIMPFLTELICDGCSFRQEFHLLYCYFGTYVLPNSLEIPMPTEVAWCGQCGRVVEVERLLPLSDVDAELARCGVGRSYAMDWWGEDGYWSELRSSVSRGWRISRDEYAGYVRVIRDWLTSRVSPPRCLSCGGNRLEQVLLDGPFRHPGCSGTIRTVYAVHEVLIADYTRFTSEGRPLIEETP